MRIERVRGIDLLQAGGLTFNQAGQTELEEAARAQAGHWYYPIAPDDQLYLSATDHGDDACFARLFREVWFTIPHSEREEMKEHWSSAGPGVIPNVIGPLILLEAFSALRDRRCRGNCESAGSVLRFFAPVIDQMPTEHVKSVIAHELGHVLHWSRGEAFLPKPPSPEQIKLLGEKVATALAYLDSPAERWANAAAERWGFDPAAVDRWDVKHVAWERYACRY